MTVRFDVREKRGGRTRRLDDQRFEEGTRSRGPLFDVRVAEVLYRSSESTREILHPRRNQRRVESSRRKGRVKERRTGTATRQVSRGRTLIEKKGDTRERKKGRGRKKQGARRSFERYGRRFIAGNLPWPFFPLRWELAYRPISFRSSSRNVSRYRLPTIRYC